MTRRNNGTPACYHVDQESFSVTMDLGLYEECEAMARGAGLSVAHWLRGIAAMYVVGVVTVPADVDPALMAAAMTMARPNHAGPRRLSGGYLRTPATMTWEELEDVLRRGTGTAKLYHALVALGYNETCSKLYSQKGRHPEGPSAAELAVYAIRAAERGIPLALVTDDAGTTLTMTTKE